MYLHSKNIFCPFPRNFIAFLSFAIGNTTKRKWDNNYKPRNSNYSFSFFHKIKLLKFCTNSLMFLVLDAFWVHISFFLTNFQIFSKWAVLYYAKSGFVNMRQQLYSSNFYTRSVLLKRQMLGVFFIFFFLAQILVFQMWAAPHLSLKITAFHSPQLPSIKTVINILGTHWNMADLLTTEEKVLKLAIND